MNTIPISQYKIIPIVNSAVKSYYRMTFNYKQGQNIIDKSR